MSKEGKKRTDRLGFLLDNRIIIPFAFKIKKCQTGSNETFYPLNLFLNFLFPSSLFHKKKHSLNILIR